MHIPEWHGPVEGFSKNQIKKNLWKFQALDYEYEDLLHEAVICFCHCKSRYDVETPQHFMGLFKRALHNRFYDLSMKSSVEKEMLIEEGMVIGITNEEDSDFLEDNKEFHNYSIGPLRALLKSAPVELKQVLELVFNAPVELLESFGFFKKRNDRGFSDNKRLCSMLGYNHAEVNLVKQLKEYLS